MEPGTHKWTAAEYTFNVLQKGKKMKELSTSLVGGQVMMSKPSAVCLDHQAHWGTFTLNVSKPRWVDGEGEHAGAENTQRKWSQQKPRHTEQNWYSKGESSSGHMCRNYLNDRLQTVNAKAH